MSKRKLENNTATVIFDLETSGFCPLPMVSKYHKIVQISAKLIETGQFFDSFVNPEMEIIKVSVNIHHIDNDMVKDAKTIDGVIDDLWKAFSLNEYDTVRMIAHNCDFFDKIVFMKECMGFLNTDKIEFWDTLPWLRENLNKVLGKSNAESTQIYKLEHLYEFLYDKELENAHRSDADVRALSEIYIDFIKPNLDNTESEHVQLVKKIKKDLITDLRFIGAWRASLIYEKTGIYSLIDLKRYFSEKVKTFSKSLDVFLQRDLGIWNKMQRMMIISQILDVELWSSEIYNYLQEGYELEDCINNVDYYVKYKYKLKTKPKNICRYNRGLIEIKNKDN